MKRALEYREYRDVQAVPRARGHRLHLDRSRIGHAGHAELPQDAHRSLHRRHGTGRGLSRCTAGAAASPRSPDGIPVRRPPHRRAAHSAPTITGSQGDGQVPADPAARRAARQAAGQAASSAAPRRPPPKEEPKKRRRRKGFSSGCCVCLNSSKGAIWLTDLGPSLWRRVLAPLSGSHKQVPVTPNSMLDGTRAAQAEAPKPVLTAESARRYFHGSQNVSRSHRSLQRRFAEGRRAAQ